MADFEKPDMKYLWAETGVQIKPEDVKIQEGWVEQIPPFEWENWVQNRQDRAISYIFQKGIPEWDESTEYIAMKSFIQYDGAIYRASTTHTGRKPDENPSYWDVVFS